MAGSWRMMRKAKEGRAESGGETTKEGRQRRNGQVLRFEERAGSSADNSLPACQRPDAQSSEPRFSSSLLISSASSVVPSTNKIDGTHYETDWRKEGM